jgi:chromosome segregation ATPase
MENIAEIKMVVDAAIEENQSIKDLKTDVSVLKTDVSALKTDVSALKTDVSVLKTDVAELKVTAAKHSQKLDRLDEKIHHQGLLFENMQKDLKLILDAVIPSKERVMQINKIEDLVDQHDHRLHALEITLKDHVRSHPKS